MEMLNQDRTLTPDEAKKLQNDLKEVFDRHGIACGTGLIQGGVKILNQDARIRVQDVGGVEAYSGSE